MTRDENEAILLSRLYMQNKTINPARLTHGELRIIYKHNKPYGIRDEGGYLFFFTQISKWPDQEERYRREVLEQYALADFLIGALKKRTI